MEQQQQAQTPTPPLSNPTPLIEQPPTTTAPPQSQPQSQSSQPNSHPSPAVSSSSPSNPNPKPQPYQNPNTNTFAASNVQPRPPFSRPAWPSSSVQRGGMAIGVPAATPPSPHSASFTSSFAQQQFARGPLNTATSQLRQQTPGYMGPAGLGSSSQMRPGGMTVHQQQRPVQSSIRPQAAPVIQPATTQSFQGHGLLRGTSVGSTALPSPSTSQSNQTHNQPWLSSGSQGRPSLASPQFRSQVNPPTFPQRSHIPQQQQQPHSLTTITPPQQMSSVPQTPPSMPPSQQPEQQRQQFPPARVTQSITHQLQMQRLQGTGNQKPPSLATPQPGPIQPAAQTTTSPTESGESCNRILSKRSIHELVSQVDPSEKLDPEVEDILVDIADEFVESVTTFGCSLAKHRKSTTLEAKDILLHLEKNWNMTLPGFGGDEIKCFRKPIANEIHRERLAAIKKSLLLSETTNSKLSSGQAAGSGKSLAKPPGNAMDKQN